MRSRGLFYYEAKSDTSAIMTIHTIRLNIIAAIVLLQKVVVLS